MRKHTNSTSLVSNYVPSPKLLKLHSIPHLLCLIHVYDTLVYMLLNMCGPKLDVIYFMYIIFNRDYMYTRYIDSLTHFSPLALASHYEYILQKCIMYQTYMFLTLNMKEWLPDLKSDTK